MNTIYLCANQGGVYSLALFFESAIFEHQFWLRILGDHSRFIRDSLYPSEKEDIAKASQFIQVFDQFHAQLKQQNETTILPFTNKVEEAVNELKALKLSIIRRHITGQMKIHLTPSFVNHMVNELEEFQRIIGYLKQEKLLQFSTSYTIIYFGY